MLRRLPIVLAALAVAGCSPGARPAHATQQIEVAVSVSACGSGWTSGRPGPQQFALHNTDSRPGAVDLIDPARGAVYAEVEPLAPGTTTTLQANLGSGRYAFRCVMEDEPAVTGPTVTLPGHRRGTTPAVRPVSEAELIAATKAYEAYVTRSLPGLQDRVAALHAALAGGNLAEARRAWLPAHLAYLRLGAAYDAFGELDADIDGRAAGLPGGVHDRSWRGLHRIEFGLWHGQPAGELTPIAADLVAAVRALRRAFPHAQLDPLDIAIRAHEITEDAVEFALTGRDDYGSHSGLATVSADLDGTRTVLSMIRPLLAGRYGGMTRLDAWLARAERDIDAARRDARPALDSLDRTTRERVNSDVSELAELLAPIAAILEPRRTS